ncbi:MAG: aspartate kinase [Spirochaetes bacterium]|nr:aspartate kinase [Spirochaetota bacterium]MBN2769684.1 aspartate kinase [Spirochaetota bacterium]
MSKRVVCKFGGSSVADTEQFKKIKNIINSDSKRKIIVVSAPGKRNSKETKLTDLFYSTYDLATKGVDISGPWSLICERYLEITKELGLKTEINGDLLKLEKQLRETPDEVTSDYLVSRGEFLCARIMAEYLEAEFVDSYPLIKFDSRYRVLDQSYQDIRESLSDDSKIYVVPGFYGSDTKGNLKTFTRGGSDITGAILAKACDAEVYENWTDVSGLLMADPRIVDNARPMAYVSYREIRELSYSGASVLHDEAIAPCRDKDIKINIRNTNFPEDSGTMIGPEPEGAKQVITGIAGRTAFSMIHIEKSMMNKERGFGRKVLGILENHNLSYEHSPTGIDSMSIVLDSKSFADVEDDVLEDIRLEMNPDSIKVIDNLALIATVGHGMAHKVGVAAKLFGALAEEKINVRVIDQGSSELNIIIGIDENDYEKSIKAIYKAFVD